MEMVEKVLKMTAWAVGIVAGLTTIKKNVSDLKDKKKRRSPKKKRRK